MPPLPVPLLLSVSKPKLYNGIVGSEPSQIRLAEGFLKESCVSVDQLDDAFLLSDASPHLVRLPRGEASVDVSQSMRSKLSLWTAYPLSEGSPATTALAKLAASALNTTISATNALKVSKGLFRSEAQCQDLRAFVWELASRMCDELSDNGQKIWPRPWEPGGKWPGEVASDDEMARRLHNCYLELAAWTLLRVGDIDEARRILSGKTGWMRRVESLRLDAVRVAESLVVLSCWRSGWRQHNVSPYSCALNLRRVWRY